jgi:hypothetical protein
MAKCCLQLNNLGLDHPREKVKRRRSNRRILKMTMAANWSAASILITP